MNTHAPEWVQVMVDEVDWRHGIGWGMFTRDGHRLCVPLADDAARFCEEALNHPDTPDQGVSMTINFHTVREP